MAAQPGHHAGPDLDSRLVDIERRGMYSGSDALFDVHHPEPVKASGDLPGVIAKILRSHPHFRFQYIVRAQELPCFFPGYGIQGFVIMHHRISDIDMEVDLRPHAVYQLRRLLTDKFMRSETPLLVHSAESPHQLDLTGDHIRGMPSLYGSNG